MNPANNIFYFFNLILILISMVIFILALKKSKQSFYSDTFLLAPLGIFVWGDALILAPFWIISAVIFFFLSWVNILRYILLFYSLRSFFEVFYWLNHQAVKSDYKAPLFKKIKWMNPDMAAILYQLINFVACIFFLFAFILTLI